MQVELVYRGVDVTTKAPTTVTPTTINFNLDPAHTSPNSNGRNWWLTIGPISFTVTVPAFGPDPLLTINGEFAADDQSTPGLTKLTVEFGSALDTLQSIFNNLQALASFLPGGVGAGLDVSLSNGKLTVRDTFVVPTLPLGLGNLSDISLDLGLTITLSPLSADFIVGIGNPGNPFNWVVSPLAGQRRDRYRRAGRTARFADPGRHRTRLVDRRRHRGGFGLDHACRSRLTSTVRRSP